MLKNLLKLETFIPINPNPPKLNPKPQALNPKPHACTFRLCWSFAVQGRQSADLRNVTPYGSMYHV